jgi:hypothetical protein
MSPAFDLKEAISKPQLAKLLGVMGLTLISGTYIFVVPFKRSLVFIRD